MRFVILLYTLAASTRFREVATNPGVSAQLVNIANMAQASLSSKWDSEIDPAQAENKTNTLHCNQDKKNPRKRMRH